MNTTTTTSTPTHNLAAYFVGTGWQVEAIGDDYRTRCSVITETKEQGVEQVVAIGAARGFNVRDFDGTILAAPAVAVEIADEPEAAPALTAPAADYKLDARGALHRPNGQFASLAERNEWEKALAAPVRMATCTKCGAEQESAVSIPFFEPFPSREKDAFYCGCQGHASRSFLRC